MKLVKGLLTLSTALLLAVAAGCGGSSTPSEGTSPTPTPSAATKDVHVYFLHGEKVVSVHRAVPVAGQAVATAAMTALLAGPTSREQAAGIVSTIPAGTTLHGVVIKSGTADVDLSAAYGSGGGSLSMTARIMQVVFTLTQFATVQQVTFRLDGKPISALGGEGVMVDKPQTRADWESFLPPIFIDSPAWGESVASPIVVEGVANVFEGQFSVELRDSNDKVVTSVPAHASMGSYSPFSVTLSTNGASGSAHVVGFDTSAKDGSRIDTYTVPVYIG